jgi:hypothetical protein
LTGPLFSHKIVAMTARARARSIDLPLLPRWGGYWLADGPWQSVGMLIEHRGRTLQVDPSAGVAPTAVVCGDLPG